MYSFEYILDSECNMDEKLINIFGTLLKGKDNICNTEEEKKQTIEDFFNVLHVYNLTFDEVYKEIKEEEGINNTQINVNIRSLYDTLYNIVLERCCKNIYLPILGVTNGKNFNRYHIGKYFYEFENRLNNNRFVFGLCSFPYVTDDNEEEHEEEKFTILKNNSDIYTELGKIFGI